MTNSGHFELFAGGILDAYHHRATELESEAKRAVDNEQALSYHVDGQKRRIDKLEDDKQALEKSLASSKREAKDANDRRTNETEQLKIKLRGWENQAKQLVAYRTAVSEIITLDGIDCDEAINQLRSLTESFNEEAKQ